jgi:hypothetical protein
MSIGGNQDYLHDLAEGQKLKSHQTYPDSIKLIKGASRKEKTSRAQLSYPR